MTPRVHLRTRWVEQEWAAGVAPLLDFFLRKASGAYPRAPTHARTHAPVLRSPSCVVRTTRPVPPAVYYLLRPLQGRNLSIGSTSSRGDTAISSAPPSHATFCLGVDGVFTRSLDRQHAAAAAAAQCPRGRSCCGSAAAAAAAEGPAAAVRAEPAPQPPLLPPLLPATSAQQQGAPRRRVGTDPPPPLPVQQRSCSRSSQPSPIRRPSGPISSPWISPRPHFLRRCRVAGAAVATGAAGRPQLSGAGSRWLVVRWWGRGWCGEGGGPGRSSAAGCGRGASPLLLLLLAGMGAPYCCESGGAWRREQLPVSNLRPLFSQLR